MKENFFKILTYLLCLCFTFLITKLFKIDDFWIVAIIAFAVFCLTDIIKMIISKVKNKIGK